MTEVFIIKIGNHEGHFTSVQRQRYHLGGSTNRKRARTFGFNKSTIQKEICEGPKINPLNMRM